MPYQKEIWGPGGRTVPTIDDFNKFEQGIADSFKSEFVNVIKDEDVKGPNAGSHEYGMGTHFMRIHGDENPQLLSEWLNSIGVTPSTYNRSIDQLRANVEISMAGSAYIAGYQRIVIYDWSSSNQYRIYGVFVRANNSISGTNWGRWQEEVLVFERGQNSNGRFIRYTDGTQKCFFEDSSLTRPTSSVSGIQWGNKSFNFPASFASIPNVTPICRRTAGGSIQWSGLRSASTSSCDIYIFAVNDEAEGHLGYVAEGRWR